MINEASKSPNPANNLVWQAGLVLTVSCVVLFIAALGVSRSLEMASSWGDVILPIGLVGWLASLVGIGPMWMMGRYGIEAICAGYFAGMISRLAIFALAATACVYGLNLAVEPVVAVAAWYYLPLLFVEVLLVSRYLNKYDIQRTDEASLTSHLQRSTNDPAVGCQVPLSPAIGTEVAP